MPRVLLELPTSLRAELKEPLGAVVVDVETLLDGVGRPLITVGDIVTYHVQMAGVEPDLALFDERTKREPVDEKIGKIVRNEDHQVENPAGTLTEELLEAVTDGIAANEPARVRVIGEEDLAALPAIIAAPLGSSVVYGQPDEGMVHVVVTENARQRARSLVRAMEGEVSTALEILDS